MKSGKITTLSEYTIASENRITPIPADTSDELASLLGCGLSTALGTINEEANVKFGESVMIVGAGGLGVNLIKAAKLASAFPIIVLDVHENKKDVCESMGADLFINTQNSDTKEEIIKKFGIKDVDVIIETSGNRQAIEETLPLLSSVGRFILIGQPKPGETVGIVNAHHLFGGEGKMIKATQGGKFSPSRDIPRYLKLHKAGILNIGGIITHRMKLDQINEAIGLIRKGQAGRILIEM